MVIAAQRLSGFFSSAAMVWMAPGTDTKPSSTSAAKASTSHRVWVDTSKFVVEAWIEPLGQLPTDNIPGLRLVKVPITRLA